MKRKRLNQVRGQFFRSPDTYINFYLTVHSVLKAYDSANSYINLSNKAIWLQQNSVYMTYSGIQEPQVYNVLLFSTDLLHWF